MQRRQFLGGILTGMVATTLSTFLTPSSVAAAKAAPLPPIPKYKYDIMERCSQKYAQEMQAIEDARCLQLLGL